MRHTLESIIGSPVSDWSWLKATLPSSRGGLNLRSALRHAPAAYLASHTTSFPLVERILGHPPGPSAHINSVVSALSSSAARPEWRSLENIDVPIRQHHLSVAIDEASYHLLLSSTPTIRAQALVLSSSLPYAGEWLNVIPSSTLGLHFYGDHQVGCGGNGDRISHHNSIQDVVFASAQSDPFIKVYEHIRQYPL